MTCNACSSVPCDARAEAATVAAMHEQTAPDLEFTPITAHVPRLVPAAQLDAARAENARLRFRIEALEAHLTRAEIEAADAYAAHMMRGEVQP